MLMIKKTVDSKLVIRVEASSCLLFPFYASNMYTEKNEFLRSQCIKKLFLLEGNKSALLTAACNAIKVYLLIINLDTFIETLGLESIRLPNTSIEFKTVETDFYCQFSDTLPYLRSTDRGQTQQCHRHFLQLLLKNENSLSAKLSIMITDHEMHKNRLRLHNNLQCK